MAAVTLHGRKLFWGKDAFPWIDFFNLMLGVNAHLILLTLKKSIDGTTTFAAIEKVKCE